VVIGDECGIWFNAVVRGDSNSIRIGNRTNIQDLCMVHVDDTHRTFVGDDVTVGHRAIIHGAKIGNRCLIGMGAVIMNGAVIGDDSIIGAGALVTENQNIPPKSLVIGFPAKPKRELTEEEIKLILRSSKHYVEYAKEYIEMNSL
jgi:carbonic anhydrase/acetyltransferase-like protein (isoleucine patch superfamily)